MGNGYQAGWEDSDRRQESPMIAGCVPAIRTRDLRWEQKLKDANFGEALRARANKVESLRITRREQPV
jgi:hypothetical protein